MNRNRESLRVGVRPSAGRRVFLVPVVWCGVEENPSSINVSVRNAVPAEESSWVHRTGVIGDGFFLRFDTALRWEIARMRGRAFFWIGSLRDQSWGQPEESDLLSGSPVE